MIGGALAFASLADQDACFDHVRQELDRSPPPTTQAGQQLAGTSKSGNVMLDLYCIQKRSQCIQKRSQCRIVVVSLARA